MPAGSGTVAKSKLSFPGKVLVELYSSRNWSPAGSEIDVGRNVEVLANSVCDLVVSMREMFEPGPPRVAESDANSALPVTLKAEFRETNTFPSAESLVSIAEADPVIYKPSSVATVSA
jgi:hypothetical protein